AKGFTVVMVMLTGVGPGKEPNLAGERPWINQDPASPNPSYFDHMDAVLKWGRENDLQLLIGIYHQTYATRMHLTYNRRNPIGDDAGEPNVSRNDETERARIPKWSGPNPPPWGHLSHP